MWYNPLLPRLPRQLVLWLPLPRPSQNRQGMLAENVPPNEALTCSGGQWDFWHFLYLFGPRTGEKPGLLALSFSILFPSLALAVDSIWLLSLHRWHLGPRLFDLPRTLSTDWTYQNAVFWAREICQQWWRSSLNPVGNPNEDEKQGMGVGSSRAQLSRKSFRGPCLPWSPLPKLLTTDLSSTGKREICKPSWKQRNSLHRTTSLSSLFLWWELLILPHCLISSRCTEQHQNLFTMMKKKERKKEIDHQTQTLNLILHLWLPSEFTKRSNPTGDGRAPQNRGGSPVVHQSRTEPECKICFK